MEAGNLLERREEGIYCPAGDFYIDPWKPVQRAVITHGHSDHARPGSSYYLCHHHSAPILKLRLGDFIRVQGLEYGEVLNMNGLKLSLHPAGHIPGSAQVLVESAEGERWVVSGDYKTEDDGFCAPFEAVPCHVFTTESTFGLPIYRWAPAETEFEAIHNWWRQNQNEGRCSVLTGYALGKAQRLLAGLNPEVGPIYVHGAIHRVNEVITGMGYQLPSNQEVSLTDRKVDYSRALVMATPSGSGSAWMRRFGKYSLALASGWMQIRGPRRRRAADRGFVLSDHADWDGLNEAVDASGAERVYVTHGYSQAFARWLTERGLDGRVLETTYTGERAEIGEASEESVADLDSAAEEASTDHPDQTAQES